MRRLMLVCTLVLFVTGCGGEQSWHSKDISGLMPELQFTLMSEDGKTVTADHYGGEINLLYFGYTHCPDVCPITLGRLRGVLNKLDPKTADQVRILFVSVDPKRDDPQALSSYTDSFGERFIGLTGTRDQLDTLTKRYRTTYGYGEPDANGNYEVSHGSAVYAFDRDGNPRLLIRADDPIDAVAEDVEQLVSTS